MDAGRQKPRLRVKRKCSRGRLMPDKDHRVGPLNPKPHRWMQHGVPPDRKGSGRMAMAGAIAIAVLGVGWWLWHGRAIEQGTEDQSVATVQVIRIKSAKAGADLTLPGDVQAYTSAPIHAQVSGYVQKWFFDIGAHVKKGDLLAQIDPRSYEAALAQARGALARDSATLTNAREDLKRYQALAAQNAVSVQKLATQQATAEAQAGIVDSDRAQVTQASINLAYTRIVAPFDGIVTSRSVDVGNLVNIGTANATPLFTIADQSNVRLYVRVPQDYAPYIRPGMMVTFTVPQHPGRVFQAQLVASASTVASATGTMLVQFRAENSDGTLQPGGYAEIKF